MVTDDARLMMRLMVLGQERERRHLCDTFHDGPLQDFTAILLQLDATLKSVNGQAAERLATLEAELRDVVNALRMPAPTFRAARTVRTVLESGLSCQIVGPLSVAIEPELVLYDPVPTYAEAAEILAAVQILLLEADQMRPALHALVTVRSSPGGITLTMRVTPDPRTAAEDPEGFARDRAARFARVARLTGADITEHAPGGEWSAALTWPRSVPPPRGEKPYV